jgi:hypothetical protein
MIVNLDVSSVIENSVKRFCTNSDIATKIVDDINSKYVLEFTPQGDFTIATLVSIDMPGVVFAGVSKRSKNDKFNPVCGRAYALSRAIKQLVHVEERCLVEEAKLEKEAMKTEDIPF